MHVNLLSKSTVECRMNSNRLTPALITTSLVAAACLVALLYVAKHQPTASDVRRWNAEAQIGLLNDRLERYAAEHGRPPENLRQLTESSEAGGPYARDKDLLDPYGRAFVYIAPGAHGAFDIVFLGKDGKPGGAGYDADFGNWELTKDR